MFGCLGIWVYNILYIRMILKINKNISRILVIFVLFIISIELIPYFSTIFFKDLCYGCTSIGKFHQYLNNSFGFAYFVWVLYLLLFLYGIYCALWFKNSLLKYFAVFVCLFMIYLPTLPLLNLITIFLMCIYKNPPFIYDYKKVFPASENIETHSDEIINEYRTFVEKNKPECIRKSNPGFIIENTNSDDNCWRIIYLKKAGVIESDMISKFPITIEAIQDSQIHNAFFSILDPGVEIPAHTGYYQGYLRYHMGVDIPNNNSNRMDDKAYIVCGGEKYIWKEEEGVVFDDMYLHYVKNDTNMTRVVLYLDIKRQNHPVINSINELGIFLIENSILFHVFLKNQHNQKKLESG